MNESLSQTTTPIAESGTVQSVEQLASHVEDLARQIADALVGSSGTVLSPGPAERRSGAGSLLPTGTVHGVIAGLRDTPGAVQVVLLLDESTTTSADPEQADPAVPEPWMAPIAAAMERWAAELGGMLTNAMPVTDPAGLQHLLVDSADTTLVGAGLFAGSELAGSVAVVGRLAEEPAPGPAAPTQQSAPAAAAAPATPPTAHAPAAPAAGPSTLDAMQVLAEVEMKVTAELGRTRMSVSELLGLAPGSLIELDRTAGSPIDLLVNGTLIARGEVVVVDEEYGIRLTEITGSTES